MSEIAIVTGGARGIGRAVATTLAGDGIDVVIGDLLDRPEIKEAAQETVREIEALGRRVIAVNCDVTRPEDVAELVRTATEDLGGLHIVCCNAGVDSRGKAHELSLEEWERVMRVNATGTFLTYKAAVPHLIAQGSGSIVNIASSAGQRGTRNMSHYSASKFAVIGFTESTAAEVAQYGVRVNCVCPSWVPTEMSLGPYARMKDIPREDADEAFRKLAIKGLPLKVAPSPATIGHAVLYLCRAESVTGISLPVTGGAQLS